MKLLEQTVKTQSIILSSKNVNQLKYFSKVKHQRKVNRYIFYVIFKNKFSYTYLQMINVITTFLNLFNILALIISTCSQKQYILS